MRLIILAAALLLGIAPGAEAATVQVTLEVPRAQTKSIRLRNLAGGTVMSVAVRTSGRLLLVLVGARELKASPRNPETLFRGSVERAMSFQVTIPRSGDYYLVLNNRRGSEPLKVHVTVRAKRRSKEPAKPLRATNASYSGRPVNASRSLKRSSMRNRSRRVCA